MGIGKGWGMDMSWDLRREKSHKKVLGEGGNLSWDLDKLYKNIFSISESKEK